MSQSGSFSSGGIPKNPTFAVLTVTSRLDLNSGATFNLYNTADKTTNYERLRANWNTNVAKIFTNFAGSAATRNLVIGNAGITGSEAITSGIQIRNYLSTGPVVDIFGSTSGTAGSVLFAVGSTSVHTAASGTQTIGQITGTINQSGTAGYIAFDINPTETATGSGTKLLQRWAVGGSETGRMSASGAFYAQGIRAVVDLGLTSALGVASDVSLYRDAADTLALRRSTAAQTFRVYNTYTDGSNYERGGLTWSGNVLTIGTESAGTGSLRDVSIRGSQVVLRTASTDRWYANVSGHFLAAGDNIYDIGQLSASRPRYIYSAGGIFSPYFRATATTVGALVAPGTIGNGARTTVNDSTVGMAGNFGAVVAGGGANTVPVFCDGANWRIG